MHKAADAIVFNIFVYDDSGWFFNRIRGLEDISN
tara:strand:- start:501 stop:602 length:102 start_codon:yes stop_codon:yes gene_type:complete